MWQTPALPEMFQIPRSFNILLFVAGFSMLSLEILGVKILAPYVGASMPVWGSVIAVTLLGGMAGYYAGGVGGDRRENKNVLNILAIVAGTSIFLIPFVREFISTQIQSFSYTEGALVASLLLFFIPAMLLGALITYTIRCFVRTMETVGRAHGDLYAVATLGSIAGVFATSYVLIPFFPISHILFGLGALTLLSGLFLPDRAL